MLNRAKTHIPICFITCTYICRSYSYYTLATRCATLYASIHSSYSMRHYNSDRAIKKMFSLICTSIVCTVMTTQKFVKSDEPINNLQHGSYITKFT